MTSKKTKEESGKETLAELKKITESLEQLDQKAGLQEYLGIRLYDQDDLDRLFEIDKYQSPPYLRGKEKKLRGEPIVLLKCAAEKGRPDFWYMFKKGRDAMRLNNRYSPAPIPEKESREKIKESLNESMDKIEGERQKSDRYQKGRY